MKLIDIVKPRFCNVRFSESSRWLLKILLRTQIEYKNHLSLKAKKRIYMCLILLGWPFARFMPDQSLMKNLGFV